MSQPSDASTDPIDDALARLGEALDRLEAAVARRIEAEANPDDIAAERAIMAEDRARLAAALDAASARLSEVETAADVVGRRLDRAIGAVEGVLAGPAGGHPPGT
ncbi:DUF4164 family protein [uncultured Methylobacterium sp.]|uniref:DUF4164 family protein n=1 Tax=uncultured Methylobacterium sp. TaxID=157278 RepID=UPI0035CA6758